MRARQASCGIGKCRCQVRAGRAVLSAYGLIDHAGISRGINTFIIQRTREEQARVRADVCMQRRSKMRIASSGMQQAYAALHSAKAAQRCLLIQQMQQAAHLKGMNCMPIMKGCSTSGMRTPSGVW